MTRGSGISALFLLVAGLTLGACGYSATPESVGDVKLARAIDPKGEAIEPTTRFSTADREIHAVVKLADAPSQTDVLSVWRTPSGDEMLRSHTPSNGDPSNSVNFLLKTPQGLPPGRYAFEVYVDRDADDSISKPHRTLEFVVE